MQRARERNVPVVFLARAEYHVAAVEGRGVKTAENWVRERTGASLGRALQALVRTESVSQRDGGH